MTTGLCIFTLSMEILISLLVLVSILRPERRIWPPGESKSFGRILMLFLFYLTDGGIITLGILDWGGEGFPVWIRLIGGLLWLTGMILAVWAVACLGIKNTTGNPSELVIIGPYCWTRNPQYLGFMAGLIGWGLLSGSILTLITGTTGWLPLILIPRTEEPWLLDKFRSAYAEYLTTTPRFLCKLKNYQI